MSEERSIFFESLKVHYKNQKDRAAICGLRFPHNAWFNWSKYPAEVTCETCKRILRRFNNSIEGETAK